MQYSVIAETYEKLEQTTKRLEMTDMLATLFRQTPSALIDKVVYLTQGKLYPDYEGVEIGVADKLATRALAQASGASADRVVELYRHLGDLGSAAYELLNERSQQVLFASPLTVNRVYETLDGMAKTVGAGSVEQKVNQLSSLLSDSRPREAKFLLRTVTGKLRLGVADYTVLDALAVAFTRDKTNRLHLERAYNLSSDLGAVAHVIATTGLDGIRKFHAQLGKPIRPMLAERLPTANEAIEKLGGRVAAEYKLDGERLQIHKTERDVQLFSRRLEKITSHYPDACEHVRTHVTAHDAILEAEVVAINTVTGEFLPFQELMHRRRKYGVEQAMQQYPVALYFFDVLYADGAEYVQRPYKERRAVLREITRTSDRVNTVPQIVTADPARIDQFMERAIEEGCEGLVLKDLQSVYRAGAREFAWSKLKREYRSELTDTLDLVVIGAFYGKGKRAGTYGTFLLAAYDKGTAKFYSVSKVGTGFTDEDLEKFPKLLESAKARSRPREVDSELEPDIWLEPQVVIEIIASEITLSPVHTCARHILREGSGLALRFPKFTGRIRSDKRPEDATSVDEIVRMYKQQKKIVVSA